VTVRDGTRIAIDLYLPSDLEPSYGIPTMVLQTRYLRGMEAKYAFRPLVKGRFHKTIRRFVLCGYAWVMVDARGSGASFGTRLHPFSKDEVLDGADILDWIVAQPWSNGKVGSWGNSYDGTTALFLATNNHPALKAIMPRFALFDAYSEAIFPGGIHLRWLTDTWGRMTRAMDRNLLHEFFGTKAKMAIRGVRPVDADIDRSMLSAAVEAHVDNGDMRDLVQGVVFRDDESEALPGSTVDDMSPHTRLSDLNRADTAPYLYTGWFDASFVLSEVHMFMNLDHPGKRLTIGPWDHGGWHNISPFAFRDRPRFDHDAEAMRFFDYYLKGLDTGIRNEKPVHYYTMGEGRWKAADTWPPKGLTDVSWYLLGENGLGTRSPPDVSGTDVYEVDFQAGTGSWTRWDSLVNPFHHAIDYPKRARKDRRLLVYTSEPLTGQMEVTGHPVATLYVTSSRGDGNFFVYLEDVWPNGHVTYVTEGMLRAVHRRISDDDPPYRSPVPYRTFRSADAAPLAPGEVAELRFGMYPTSYLFREGHSVRIALSGADSDHFADTTDAPTTIRVFRNSGHPSRIVLPVMPSKESR